MSKLEIITIIMAVLVVISSISLVVSVSTDDSQPDASAAELKNEVVKLRSDIEAEKQAKQAAEEKFNAAKRDIELLKKETAQPIPQPAPAVIDYDEILVDFTKLNLGNCDNAVTYAYGMERDFDYKLDDLKDEEDTYSGKLAERRAALQAAVDSNDEQGIITAEKRVDYMEEKVDDIKDEVDMAERDYRDAKRIRARAETYCKRLVAAF